MKKIWLMTTLLVAWLLLTWCDCDVNVTSDCNCFNEASNEVKSFCIDKKWTYSWITEPDWTEHWECRFPSWMGCRDEEIINQECYWEADTSSIDTEEKRLSACKETAEGWFDDFMEGAENINVEYADEEEERDEDWELSIIRIGFKAHYTKDWENWILPWECEASFLEWGIMASFDQEYLEE